MTSYDLNALQRSVDLQEGQPISKNDFSLAVLLRLGRIDQDDLERIESIFFTLDQDHSGALTAADLQSTHVLTFDAPSPRAKKAADNRASPRKGVLPFLIPDSTLNLGLIDIHL